MTELLVYPREELPPDLNWQILSFIRITAPDTFVGFDWFRYWMATTEDNDHAIHVILVENGILISHTMVVWKYLEHASETYKTYGLTGVFTYPGLRRQGCGRQIVDAGTIYIRESDADIGMFHCNPDLEPFYSRSGWIPMRNSTTLIGPKDSPIVSDELMMMLFLSEKGKRGRSTFESEPVYFGDATW